MVSAYDLLYFRVSVDKVLIPNWAGFEIERFSEFPDFCPNFLFVHLDAFLILFFNPRAYFVF